jgi:translocation and assembly module TamA
MVETLDEPNLGETLGALPKGKDAQCKITFMLGPLYHTGRIEIDGSVPDFARGELALASGAPAVAGDILAAGARLLTTLENNGFAFAKVNAPVAYQDPENHVLNVSFHVATGSRVHIGDDPVRGTQARARRDSCAGGCCCIPASPTPPSRSRKHARIF